MLFRSVGFAPTFVHAAAGTGTVVDGMHSDVFPMLAMFYGVSVLSVSFCGGTFAVLPAYIADLFGQKHAGSIHGKALTAWAASAVCGPMGLSYLRSTSESAATQDLLRQIDDKDAFEEAFGCSVEDSSAIQTLIDAKTISISRLMELAPDGTTDPTPFLYDSTCYVAAGLMGVAALANLAIRPIDVMEISEQAKNSK